MLDIPVHHCNEFEKSIFIGSLFQIKVSSASVHPFRRKSNWRFQSSNHSSSKKGLLQPKLPFSDKIKGKKSYFLPRECISRTDGRKYGLLLDHCFYLILLLACCFLRCEEGHPLDPIFSFFLCFILLDSFFNFVSFCFYFHLMQNSIEFQTELLSKKCMHVCVFFCVPKLSNPNPNKFLL